MCYVDADWAALHEARVQVPGAMCTHVVVAHAQLTTGLDGVTKLTGRDGFVRLAPANQSHTNMSVDLFFIWKFICIHAF